MTLNTLVQDGEMDGVCRTLEQIARAGADAVIVQDLAVARLARQICPDLKLHASTQMAVHNAAGLRLLNEYDGKIKALLTGIFGPENDFDAILGGVNLAGVGANGKRVVQNLLEALTPILREGAERRLKAAADTAEREAAAARAARGAV